MRLVILIGASGSGKTAIAEAIAVEYPGLVEVLHFDRIGVPSSEEMTAGWGSGEAWQRAMTLNWLAKIAAMRDQDRPVLFEGQTRLASVREGLLAANISDARVILVDCDDETRTRRLTENRCQPDLASPEERAALPAQCWRLVWRNPVNGRGALYIASHAYAIEGMEASSGKALIDELTAATTAPGSSYLHQWRMGDVVMWDNRATMHRGRPWPAREPRLMVRTTISAAETDGLSSVRPPFGQAAE